jgi:hypothetical protein
MNIRARVIASMGCARSYCSAMLGGLVLLPALPVSADPPPVTAAFDDPYDLPEAPRPPTLPELTHPDVELTFETTIGGVTPNVDPATGRRPNNVATYVQRVGLEAPIGPRRWFVGGTYELAAGEPPGGGNAKVVGGNLDFYARTVWATRTGLAFGGGLGLTLPVSSFGRDGPAQAIATAAATVRPWDEAFFQEEFLTLRPFIDVRDVDGPLVIQFREGLDWGFDMTNTPVFRVAAVSAFYLGYRFLPVLGAGLEAFELYFIDAPVDDNKRAVFAVSPSVRLMTPYVQPALSVTTNIGTPLYGSSDQFWALRLAATIVWDPITRVVEKDREEHTRGLQPLR